MNIVINRERDISVLKNSKYHRNNIFINKYYHKNVVSCGIIMYKKINDKYYYLCVHPGGPYFKYKDKNTWSIPKGVVENNESLKETACREFEEETGIKITKELKSKLIYIGYVKQKGGKIVHGWVLEDPLTDRVLDLHSDTFTMEFPKHSGNIKEFPEVDKLKYISSTEIRYKLNTAQIDFINRWEKYKLNEIKS